ncbi:30S ribosomal protein S5 [Candidatus Kuenenbacteria bacterium RIFCSPLOWO2_12_FULL_42_13]|uniref:Small ribosomal subunit protein uS5 n=5 Tax=Candidatus Kueneniibacteriota TaxID=1752740 RepID=A0A0G1B963_9BACT|nr:MAG: 30S ribosomal protein S5 [Candidatus Kuenenbacteria bacterium GW2011_GWA2_42_15]OGG89427.1 MAG: 30S ribosomal protein S5 [Candidatus Kuenenbacteria bacterium RIFCSPHIGHO2_02_FULL_42_29]OGG89785.1 MAG: 30S ribosomal protein S5 [Candidatus Kuenenbacteria bacterium RIFCSPLOWO2_02_FULL_42_16]OGG91702.1 MAG: 30S ribosomal protein S5 [Candidatus Kuenenbacteria bacterium RIFCSPLOWO2_12_FULL_42_13]OGG95882.1 MAG: 30S ribosomal protein S5 [Candidatus Kuenenbacteria bacterium RBG_16_41_7]OGH0126
MSPKPVSKNSGRSRKQRGEDSDLEQKLVDLARVTRVTKGGKRMSFRACVVVGDKAGQVSFGVAKGADTTIAINKAVAQARKIMLKVDIKTGTIPYALKEKFKAAEVMIRPGKKGRGIIAGGVIRTVLELAGYRDVVAKIIGSQNKVNNVKAIYNALKRMSK